MSSGALRAAWEAAQQPPSGLRAAWEAAQQGNPAIHEEYASGRLAKRIKRENLNDKEAADVPEMGYGQRLASHVLNTAQGIPGVKMVEAGAGSLGSKLTKHPLSYRQSLQSLDNATGDIGGKTSFLEHAMGSVAALPFLPASPMAAGAALGGADQALDANPDESMTTRAMKTVAGAGVGAVAGKVADSGITAARAMLPKGVKVPFTQRQIPVGGTTSAAQNVLGRQADRAASASKLYAKALSEGNAHTVTPEVQAFLAEPDIAPIAAEIRASRQGVGFGDPEVLDAVYKELSDRASGLKSSLGAANPRLVNSKQFDTKEVQLAKAQGIKAMGTPGPMTHVGGGSTQQPAYMPSYGDAVHDYATRSGDLDALKQGYTTLKSQSTGAAIPRFEDLTRKTPDALGEFAKKASPSQLGAAKEGVLGATKEALGGKGITKPAFRKAVSEAGPLLRTLDPNDSGSLLAKLLLGVGASSLP